MKSDPNRRNQNKYCRFHGDVGHNTNDCADLKDEIERLIREGRLQEFKAERRGQSPGNNDRRREDNRGRKDREPVGVIRTIHWGISAGIPGSRRRVMPTKQGVYQERFWTLSTTKVVKFSGTDVTFTEEDANGVHFPHKHALVVEAVVGNHTMGRILVDNGSSVDILYSDCFEKMGIPKE
ncbi:uncharacterized protein LOC112093678 [Morus notabilis]|uniref:uncharacterized protein LOC112093678 n=1 Tax=Morus notabilis TaxID=981085 RepID=UPI000CED0EF7|nr:uncharacterized protein LOC112093678 [Morus notabilis]